MVEVILFALISAFLGYRLWGVLGAKTGSEKQRQWIHDKSNDDNTINDNVIIMSKRKNQKKEKTEEPVVVIEESEVDKNARELQKKLPTFDLSQFESGAENMFKKVVASYVAGDTNKLEAFLSKKVLDGFVKAIEKRQAAGQTLHINIKATEIITQSIEIGKDAAKIIVEIVSDQIVQVFDKFGKVIENENSLKTRMIDIWTFEKQYKSKGLSWLLVKTENEKA